MIKQKVKNYPYLLPKPVVIVGAMINNKPNYLTIADVCTTGYINPRFVISSGKSHYTNQGIISNNTFSVNIPNKSIVAETDYCGIKSGKKFDKSKIFEAFYSDDYPNAPLIKEAPINFVCKLVKTVDFGDTHYLFLGEIVETYTSEEYLTNNVPDIKKVNSFSYYYDNKYWSIGEPIANAYQIGKTLKNS